MRSGVQLVATTFLAKQAGASLELDLESVRTERPFVKEQGIVRKCIERRLQGVRFGFQPLFPRPRRIPVPSPAWLEPPTPASQPRANRKAVKFRSEGFLRHVPRCARQDAVQFRARRGHPPVRNFENGPILDRLCSVVSRRGRNNFNCANLWQSLVHRDSRCSGICHPK
jgi:hypothetical protein